MTINEVIKIVKDKYPNMSISNKYYIYKNKYILNIGIKNDEFANTEIYVDQNGNIGFFDEYECMSDLDNWTKAINNSQVIESEI